MIPRFLSARLQNAATRYPVITLTGPRQSGKTTLVRNVFSDYGYFSLERPDHREFALEDPRGFLQRAGERVILDEVQHTPELFSYIQPIVDEHHRPGQYILTGSQNFLLLEKISQSLAGRTAIFHLLPFAKRELLGEKPYHPDDFPDMLSRSGEEYPDLWEMLFKGFYPRLHDQHLDTREWLAGYYQAYIERDVRSVLNVGNLDRFARFVRLCAGRTGQLINFSSLAADAGVSHATVQRWLSVLQASFIVTLVRPHYENFRKRLTKAPKLYFLDTGLLCFLLDIRRVEDLPFHALRGAIFESFVFSELYKAYLNNGELPAIYFWQDVKRHEVD
ncbi:MAG: ATP-binding protein, partial [Calditrichaeota bacterium]